VVRVTPRSKAVTAVEEIRFKHGLDNARYRPLQQPIRDRGDPQWARSGELVEMEDDLECISSLSG
jgi:hypothetical protein